MELGLHNCDCLEFMDKMIANNDKVDLIVTSPPYNMALRVENENYVSRWKNGNNKGHLTNKYNNFNDDLPPPEYEKWQNEFISKALQITDYVFYNIQMITGNKIPLLHILGKWAEKIKDIIVWDKGYAEPAINKGVLNSQWEFIICFSNIRPKCRTFDNANFERGFLSNVWKIKKEHNKDIKAGFPKELVAKILLNFSKENDIVFDPFSGSGTTAVVCDALNRRFIGCEIDPKMYETAKQNRGLFDN